MAFSKRRWQPNTWVESGDVCGCAGVGRDYRVYGAQLSSPPPLNTHTLTLAVWVWVQEG